MAFGHGKNSRFLVDNSTGGLTDISTGMIDIDFPESADNAEVTGFSDDDKLYVMGTKGHQINVTGHFSTGVDAVLNGILGTTTGGGSFEYYPNSTASNAVLKKGECLCMTYNIKGSMGGAVTYTASFVVTDSITSTYVT